LRDRGGAWVAAQVPLMLAAIVLPPWLGTLASGHARWVACTLLISGMALGIASRWALGASFTPFPRPREGGSQVHRGPYRWVRHPMYAAVVLACAGWALLWLSLEGAAMTAVLLVFFDCKARREEAWLAESYPGYADYKRRTKKLVPFVY